MAANAFAVDVILAVYLVWEPCVSCLRGFADQHPLYPANPQHRRNLRVSVVVKFDPG